jgi:hypothetical protein
VVLATFRRKARAKFSVLVLFFRTARDLPVSWNFGAAAAHLATLGCC